MVFCSVLAVLACAEPRSVEHPPPTELEFVGARFGASGGSSVEPGAARDASACVEPAQTPKLAAVSCDQREIVFGQSLAFHPRRSIPPQPARAVLDRIAVILRQRRDIQLVRVEVYGAAGRDAPAADRRREIDRAQDRADAILHYLWRRGGISAERLEAVGYAGGGANRAPKERYAVVLRILQRKGVP